MKREDAEILALNALAALLSAPEDGDRFLTLTGMQVYDLKARADDPELLAAVLDFLRADDARLRRVCDSLNCGPEEIAAARQTLPGAEQPDA